jgi:hypothetical protein
MAKRVFATQNVIGPLNPLGSAATTLTFMSIKIPSGGAAAALVDILEVLISGNASSSNIGGFFLVRSSTLSTGAATALANPNSDGLLLPSGSALAAANVITSAITFATTMPTLSSAGTDAKLNLGLNAFGGIIRWNAAPTQQWQLSGVSASGAESVLSNITGGNAQAGATANAHIIYEPY